MIPAGGIGGALKFEEYGFTVRLSETPRDRATSFDAGGGVTGWQAWLTAYTPTGKVAVTTDPLGNETRTLYDALDRPSQVTDASGRVSGMTYDLAGQELTEARGIGTPLQPPKNPARGLPIAARHRRHPCTRYLQHVDLTGSKGISLPLSLVDT